MDSSNDYVEKRKFVRIDCLMASNIVSIGQPSTAEACFSACLTKNISAGGLLFRDARKYTVGQLVAIEIDPGALAALDNNVAHIIKINGFVFAKIVRIEELDEGKLFDYGVCFVEADDDELDYFQIFQDLLNKIEFDI